MALVVCRTGDWFGVGPAHRALHFAAPVLICSDPLLRGCQQPQSCGQEQTLWMSELDLVLAELRGLRQELGELTQRVAALERSGGGGSRGFSAPASPVTVNYSFSSPLVPYAGGSGIGSSPTAELQAPVPVASPAEEAVPEDQTEERFRLEVASGVGRFFARALSGDHRGGSGRERVHLPSRVYVVCRDFAGRRYDPVLIKYSFAAIRSLVKPHGDCGNSVFAGLPTVWEAQTAVRSAGLTWPADGTA